VLRRRVLQGTSRSSVLTSQHHIQCDVNNAFHVCLVLAVVETDIFMLLLSDLSVACAVLYVASPPSSLPSHSLTPSTGLLCSRGSSFLFLTRFSPALSQLRNWPLPTMPSLHGPLRVETCLLYSTRPPVLTLLSSTGNLLLNPLAFPPLSLPTLLYLSFLSPSPSYLRSSIVISPGSAPSCVQKEPRERFSRRRDRQQIALPDGSPPFRLLSSLQSKQLNNTRRLQQRTLSESAFPTFCPPPFLPRHPLFPQPPDVSSQVASSTSSSPSSPLLHHRRHRPRLLFHFVRRRCRSWHRLPALSDETRPREVRAGAVCLSSSPFLPLPAPTLSY
jgi:hypothetical protein